MKYFSVLSSLNHTIQVPSLQKPTNVQEITIFKWPYYIHDCKLYL